MVDYSDQYLHVFGSFFEKLALSNIVPDSVQDHEILMPTILLTCSKHGETIDINMSGSHHVHIYVTDLYHAQNLTTLIPYKCQMKA